MDLFEGPAALGGIIMSVALIAWALGRWQSGFAVVGDGAAPEPACAGTAGLREAPAPVGKVPAAPSPQSALADRQGLFEHAASLGELHAEISAYRRAQQVLTTLESDPLQLSVLPQGGRADWRYPGLIGEPTCAMPAGARPVSRCESGS